ncbi:hypothetical protein UFOVP116_142 [uncultured Caudovirales phage]|uniref:Uncharacterized protein n=1 Tax=uncultured Caudovirales phage TaxID=2100421 RepID=A0A6J5L6W3_9CAUD|nr:hypothetical protein UFOVP116_142 [uncultured Caudovirales phage]
MTEHDRSNLSFLINSTPETIADWYATATNDDLLYAKELLAAWRVELTNLAFDSAWAHAEHSLEQANGVFKDAADILKKYKKIS